MTIILLVLCFWGVFSLALIPVITGRIHIPRYGASAPKKARQRKLRIVKS